MQQDLQNKTLALFFTYGVSLKLWQERGMLARELALYKYLGGYFKKIYFITYGEKDNEFSGELEKYNIEVLHKKSRLPNFFYSLFLPFIYKKELKKADYFKTNQMLGSWTAVIAKIFFAKKLIVRTGYTLSIFSKKDSSLKYLLAKIIEKIALMTADIFVVATAGEVKYFYKYSGKIRVIPNYVNTELFKPMPELNNNEPETILLFIGRFNKQKNLINLLKALKGIEKVKLQLIGSGKLKAELQTIVRDFNLNVEFIVNQPHEALPKYINFADLFVMPSLYEGNPKLLLEAMACGATVLTTDVKGINNIITDKVNGMLAKIDSDSIRELLLEYLNNKDKYSVLGEGARQYILNNHSLDIIVEKELKNYA